MSVLSRRPAPARRTRSRVLTGLLGATVLVTGTLAPVLAAAPSAPGAGTPTVDPAALPDDPMGGLLPTVHYEEYLEHAADTTTFAPGERVTVGFTPRPGDPFKVGGAPARALPAGRLTGRELREAGIKPGKGNAPAPSSDVAPDPTTTPSPEPEVDPSSTPTEDPTTEPTAAPPTTEPDPSASTDPAPSSSVDQPAVDPAAVIEATGASFSMATDGQVDAQAVVSPDGLRKEIFGFLPYWELSDSSTVLDYAKLSTIAFFGVGAAADGSLEKTKDGATTVGWSGWTSSRMTNVINAAHANHTRVVLTVQSFAWSTAGATKQKALLGSSTARANLAKQIATTIRDRGADGVNLDFEPLASGYAEEFTALVRKVRAELDAVQKGYQLTFDTTGYIGNYPLEDATAAGGADAIFIMGYDYRTASSARVGSIAPLNASSYDIVDTIKAYTARVPPSKLILGVPYYGRAWSTATSDFRAENISGTKYGASSTVVYSTAVDYLGDHGRRYDSGEGVAWTAYKREHCTSTYGCVTPWRQLYVDDAAALKAKYDLINRYGLRGAGIWALGYDGSRPELWAAIRDKFITDSSAPVAGIMTLPQSVGGERFEVSWASRDDVGVVSHDVQVSIDGGPWAQWLTRTTRTTATYVGARGHGFAFRVRARDPKGNLSSWTNLPTYDSTPSIKVGGFGRVATDQLNARSGPATTNPLLATLGSGDLLAFLEGPVSSGGYTWYRVAAEPREWSIVSTSTRTDLWVAVSGGGTTFVTPAVAPNSTRVITSATLASTAGAEWYPLSPTRLLDTRVGNGLSGAFVDERPRTFQLTGRGSIPADAVAVTANLTVTGATGPGYVAIGPTMDATPSTSTINLAKGQTLANGITLRIAADGTVGAVYLSGTAGAKAHLVLDVTGYYQVGGSGATWSPLKPTRLLDTRSGNGLSGRFTSRKVRTLQIAGRGSIPSDAIAVTGNLTATGSTTNGYVSMGPTMTSSPATSTLNLTKGKTVANNVTVKLGSGGTAGLVFMGGTGATIHLVFDATGYYRAGNGGAEWYPLTPTRLLDTREGNGLSGAFVATKPRGFQLTGRGTVPVDAVAVTANLTVTGATANGYVAIGPSMDSTPSTSTLNLAKGQTLANGVTLRVAEDGTVGAVWMSVTGAKAQQVLDLTGYFR